MDEKILQKAIEDTTKGVQDLQKEIKSLKDVDFKKAFDKVEDISTKLQALEGIDAKYVKKQQEQLDDISGKLKQLVLTNGTAKPMTLKQGLEKTFQSEQFKKMCDPQLKGSANFNIQTKYAGTVIDSSTAYLAQDTGTIMILQEEEPGVAHVPFRTTPFTDMIEKGAIGENKNAVNWVERVTITDNTASVAEVGVFNNILATWERYLAKVKKIGDFIKVTREDLEDWEYTTSEVMDLLNNLIPRNLEYELVNATGASADFTGILSYAKTYSKPSGLVVAQGNKTIYDVLKAAALQVNLGNIALGYGQGFRPNFVMMHPTDIANMHLSKDTIGQYILPPFVAANGLEVDGMRVLSSFDLTQDTFLVGDSTKAKLFSKRGLQVRMWEQVGEDPLYDQVTFTASLRAAFRVKVLERYAFVTGTFTAAMATL